MAHQTGAYPGFCSMKRQRVFQLPLDGMLVHRSVTPQALRSPVIIYTPGCRAALSEGGARSGDDRTNHGGSALINEI